MIYTNAGQKNLVLFFLYNQQNIHLLLIAKQLIKISVWNSEEKIVVFKLPS